jgi:hypothetical protein
LYEAPLISSDDALLTAEVVVVFAFLFDTTEVVCRGVIAGSASFVNVVSDFELFAAERSATEMPANDDAAAVFVVSSSGINRGG